MKLLVMHYTKIYSQYRDMVLFCVFLGYFTHARLGNLKSEPCRTNQNIQKIKRKKRQKKKSKYWSKIKIYDRWIYVYLLLHARLRHLNRVEHKKKKKNSKVETEFKKNEKNRLVKMKTLVQNT